MIYCKKPAEIFCTTKTKQDLINCYEHSSSLPKASFVQCAKQQFLPLFMTSVMPRADLCSAGDALATHRQFGHEVTHEISTCK
jgi:hypothetical protein